MFGAQRLDVGLLEVGVALDLVDGGHHVGLVEHNALQFQQPLGGVGLPVRVRRECAGEPLAGLVLAPHGEQRVGVRVP